MVFENVPLLAITGFITIAIGFFILLAGYRAAKTKEFNNHKHIMILAVIVLLLFLIQYIVRAVVLGQETHFEGPNTIRNFVYLPILAVHITFAIITIGLISVHLTKSLKQEESTLSGGVMFPKEYRPKHRKLGRITFFLWLFSYLGGIIIFIMLYVMDFESNSFGF